MCRSRLVTGRAVDDVELEDDRTVMACRGRDLSASWRSSRGSASGAGTNCMRPPPFGEHEHPSISEASPRGVGDRASCPPLLRRQAVEVALEDLGRRVDEAERSPNSCDTIETKLL
jgi:hypothetical protein